MNSLNRLRIIIVLLEAPVPFGNAAGRWYYVLLRELVARGHQVTCLAACSKSSEIEESRRLFSSVDIDLRLYLFPTRRGLRSKLATLRRPFSYMFSDEMKNDLQVVLALGYDILHLEQLWCGWLGMGHRNKTLLNVHYLFSTDLKDVRQPGILAWCHYKYLVLRAEKNMLHAFSHINTLSEQLRIQISKIAAGTTASVVPLGIDPELYPFIADENRIKTPVVSVIGSMDWYPTYSAAIRLLTRLWPEIKRQVPEAKLQIVGWNAKSALKEFVGNSDITITENVPDIKPYFEQTAVMLYAPAHGSGMKIKILEALGFGVPVVTTSDGVEGLPAAVDGVHVGVCEDDGGLIERTVKLLADPAAQNRQRIAGRALLEKHCAPKVTVDEIEKLYGRIMNDACERESQSPLTNTCM